MRANVAKRNRAFVPVRIRVGCLRRYYGNNNDRCDKNRISKFKADCAVAAHGIDGRIIPRLVGGAFFQRHAHSEPGMLQQHGKQQVSRPPAWA